MTKSRYQARFNIDIRRENSSSNRHLSIMEANDIRALWKMILHDMRWEARYVPFRLYRSTYRDVICVVHSAEICVWDDVWNRYSYYGMVNMYRTQHHIDILANTIDSEDFTRLKWEDIE